MTDEDAAGTVTWYRIEHRMGGAVEMLGRVLDGNHHWRALDLFLAHLPPDARGEIVLVDEVTGDIKARRYLKSIRRSRRAT